MTEIDLAAIERPERIRDAHSARRPKAAPSCARGLHHAAVLCADVERTIRFYQDVLEFPLTDIFENRDYKGSNHFFFDIGNGNLLAFFDFPGLDLGPYAEVLGGLHHMAISVEPARWERLKGKLDDAGVPYQPKAEPRSTSVTRMGRGMELIADPLGEMYGSKVRDREPPTPNDPLLRPRFAGPSVHTQPWPGGYSAVAADRLYDGYAE